jgi:hypothetical protein
MVSGPPGNGKSFYGVRAATLALEEGKYVAGNLELVPDWPARCARRSPVYWVRPFLRRRFLKRGRHRYHFSEDLSELCSIRLKGKKEGRGLMILDEAHNWMNARSWSESDRQEIVRFFSQHRKLGWDVLLIAQHPEMIDKQVRNLVEYNVGIRNLRKARVAGIPISPVNLFFAVWTWHGTAKRVVVKREFMRLTWRRKLYDTNATSHGLVAGAEAEKAIWLPSPPEERSQLEPGRTDAADAPARPPRPPAATPGGPHLAPSTPQPGGEHASESGEPEAWPVQVDYSPEAP